MSVLSNLDRAFCLARDCQHYDTCARAMPDDIGDNLVWTMDHCENFQATEIGQIMIEERQTCHHILQR